MSAANPHRHGMVHEKHCERKQGLDMLVAGDHAFPVRRNFSCQPTHDLHIRANQVNLVDFSCLMLTQDPMDARSGGAGHGKGHHALTLAPATTPARTRASTTPYAKSSFRACAVGTTPID